MRIDLWTLGLQAINALVLIWLLARFLFRPIAAIIAERKALAVKLLAEAEEAKAAALVLDKKANGVLAEIEASRAAAIQASGAQARTERDTLIAAARTEIEQMRANAQAAVDRAKEADRRAGMEQASLLAVDIARRLFERLPPEARVMGFFDDLMQAIAALPVQSRADFTRPGEKVLLKIPRPLTAQEDDLCRRSFVQAFGAPLDLTLEVDPALIAGLELENQHTAIRNSFRADLARIATELASHDSNG